MSITLAPQYTLRVYQWTAWKTVQTDKNGNYQYDDDGNIYTIYFYDGPEVNMCNIWLGTVPPAIAFAPDGVSPGVYPQAQNDSDKSDFEDNYKNFGNKSITPVTVVGGIDKNGNNSTLSVTLDGGTILNVQDETTNDLLKQLINKIDKMVFYLEQMSDTVLMDEDVE